MSTIKICPRCERFVNGDISICPSCGSDMIDSFVETSTWNAITPQERREIITRTTQGNTDTRTPTYISSSDEGNSTQKKKGLGCLAASLLILLFFSISSNIYHKNHPVSSTPNNSYQQNDVRYDGLGVEGFGFSMDETLQEYKDEFKTYTNRDGITISSEVRHGGLTMEYTYLKSNGDLIDYSIEVDNTVTEEQFLSFFEWTEEAYGTTEIVDYIKENMYESHTKHTGDYYQVETSYNSENGYMRAVIMCKNYS